jgi:hypothetical protein
MEAAMNLSSVARPMPCTHGCNPYYTHVHALHGHPCMHDKGPCAPVHARTFNLLDTQKASDTTSEKPALPRSHRDGALEMASE